MPSTRSAANWPASRPNTAWRSPSSPSKAWLAGSFELERTRSRDPAERPRSHAVSIEAGFVPSNETEDDVVEEEEDELEDEGAFEDEGDSEAKPPSDSTPAASNGAGTSKTSSSSRRRRSRGGRGRSSSSSKPASSSGAPSQSASHLDHVPHDGAAPELPYGDDAPTPATAHDMPMGEDGGTASVATGNGAADGTSTSSRRRRRRRGKRGSGSSSSSNGTSPQPEGMEHHQTDFASEADRFGQPPDEVDTTPTEPVHAPGAASTPVWSLKDEESAAPGDDAGKSTKKGWWQKAFGGE